MNTQPKIHEYLKSTGFGKIYMLRYVKTETSIERKDKIIKSVKPY